MIQFEPGKTYFARCLIDCETFFVAHIIKRTPKTVVYENWQGEKKRAYIKDMNGEEYFMMGHYSMAPMFRAGNIGSGE